MSITLHIIRKDLRQFWVLAALSVVFSLLETLGWYWAVIPFVGGMPSLFVGEIIPVVIQFILSVAIVQADPTVGDRAFWRTRPISPGALLSAKLAFLFLVFAVPSLLVNIYLAVSMDASLPVLAGMVVESTGMILVEAIVAAFIGSMTSTLIQAAAALLGAVVATAVVAAFIPDLPFFAPWRLDIPNHAPRMAALGLYGGVAAALLLAHQFATRRTGRTLVALAVLVPVVLFSGTTWPVSIKVAPRGTVVSVTKPLPSAGVQVMLIPPPQVWSNGFDRDPHTGRTIRTHTISINAAIRSVPEGRIVQLVSITTHLLFENGEVRDFPMSDRVYWNYWTGQAQATSICTRLGLAPPSLETEKVKEHWLRLFTLTNEKAKELSGRRATLTATLGLHELAFQEDVTLPARPGAAWVHNGQMWSVAKVSVVEGGAVADLRHLRVTSMLITEGDARPDPWFDNNRHGFVLLNRKRGEFALSAERWNSQDTPIWAMEINLKHIKFGDRWKAGGSMVREPIDDAWLADAELIILSAEPVGSLSKTVVLENFELPQVVEAPDQGPAPFWQ